MDCEHREDHVNGGRAAGLKATTLLPKNPAQGQDCEDKLVRALRPMTVGTARKFVVYTETPLEESLDRVRNEKELSLWQTVVFGATKKQVSSISHKI